MSMSSCSSCGGFVPGRLAQCPHCDRPSLIARGGRKLLAVVGGGALAMTLMACYGVAPRDKAPAKDKEPAASEGDQKADDTAKPEAEPAPEK